MLLWVAGFEQADVFYFLANDAAVLANADAYSPISRAMLGLGCRKSSRKYRLILP